jgi:hypothetical protein
MSGESIVCIDKDCSYCNDHLGAGKWDVSGGYWTDRLSSGERQRVRHWDALVENRFGGTKPDTVSTVDIINKPPHYHFSKPAIDVLSVLTECGFDMGDHYIATAIAYLCRCKKKGQYGSDLKKAQFNINKAVELHESAEKDNA